MALRQSAKTLRIIPDYLSVVISNPIEEAQFPTTQCLIQYPIPTHQLPYYITTSSISTTQNKLPSASTTVILNLHSEFLEYGMFLYHGYCCLVRYNECCFCANSTDVTEFAGESIV